MEASKKKKKIIPADVQRETLHFEHWVGVQVILEMLHFDCTHVKHKTQKYISAMVTSFQPSVLNCSSIPNTNTS
jgi:hypothetical protein